MNYQTKKTAELRKMAEEKEIKNWESLERKELIAALKKADTPKKKGKISPKRKGKVSSFKKGEKEPEPKKPAEDDEPRIITGFMGSHAPSGSKAAIMKEKLSHQPKVKIYIPLGIGEKFGGTLSVILNGYRMNILKGIYVDVPKQVADIVIESQKQTVKALEGPTRRLAGDGLPMKFNGEAPPALQ